MEMIEIDGILLEGWDGITDRREDFLEYLKHVNGCGAGNAIFDFVPDTVYGLSITPICNLHDDAYTFADKTYENFVEANNQFYRNLLKWIDINSNFIMKWPRRARAKTYYEAVNRFGYSAFNSAKITG